VTDNPSKRGIRPVNETDNPRKCEKCPLDQTGSPLLMREMSGLTSLTFALRHLCHYHREIYMAFTQYQICLHDNDTNDPV
jgi:hypothetical protein